MRYPCKGCILLGNCSRVCDKLIKITMGDVDTVLKEGICIDCGSKSFKDLRSIWLLCDECYSLFHVSQTSPIIIVRRTKLQGRSYE